MNIRKVIVTVLALTTMFQIGVSAKTVSSTVGNDIKISMSKDGKFNIQASDSSSKIYYSYKVGETKESLKSPVYTDDKIKYYSDNGTFIEEKSGMKNTPIYTSDYSTWTRANATTEVSDNSDYGKAEGYKVIQPSKATNASDTWFDVGVDDKTKYVEIQAVTTSDNKTYSSVQKATFEYDKSTFDKVNIPVISLYEKEKTADYIILTIKSHTLTDDNLLYILETTSTGGVQETTYPNTLNYEKDYKIYFNDTYTFTMYTSNGGVNSAEYKAQGLSGLGKINENKKNSGKTDKVYDPSDTEPPKITISGIPSDIERGEMFLLHIKTNEPTIISSGSKISQETTEVDMEITANGTYEISAIDRGGNETTETATIDCFPPQGTDLDINSYWNNKGSKIKLLPQTGDNLQEVILKLGFVIVACLGLATTFVRIHDKYKKTYKDEEENSNSNIEVIVDKPNKDSESTGELMDRIAEDSESKPLTSNIQEELGIQDSSDINTDK